MGKKTKEIGSKIARQLKEIKEQEKAVRTLLKEKEVRERQEKLSKEIKGLKAQRPTFFKKALKVGKTIGKGIRRADQMVTAKKTKKKSKPQPIQDNYGGIMDLVNKL